MDLLIQINLNWIGNVRIFKALTGWKWESMKLSTRASEWIIDNCIDLEKPYALYTFIINTLRRILILIQYRYL